MASHQAAKTFKKSSILGVTITQFADDIPEGCSTPDFERKPVSQTLLEGKNAIFRAVVKGVPTPDVNWKRTKGEMDDSTKYKTSFNAITNEFVLQINKLTADDTDLYRCSAVNEYGEAACTAGLRIIEGRIAGFKRKAKYVPIHPADELKKKLQDFRKMLRKRPPKPPPKPVDMEAIWQLLLHANRRDYERICMKYGISDFRGMLRKLQEMRKDTETKYGELLNSIKNQQHIRVNRKGQATFSLEMDLKNSKSKICLFKDGERVRYGTENEYRKYFLRQVGKRYNFVVNDVQPEDAGLYQVRVEDVPVFSTELEAESIPVRFKHPLRNVCCLEGETAVFECTLCTPCYDVVWLHKTHLLEASEKHQISVTPDGLTHQLIIKDVLPSDGGMYVVDTGLCFSNARLIVEYAKGKRRQNEDERDKAGWLEGQLSDKDRVKKLRQGEYLDDQDHFMDISMEEDGLYRNGQEGSQGYSSDVDGRRRFLGQEGLDEAHGNGRIRFGQFSRAEIDEDSMTSDGSSSRLTGLSGLGSSHGKDSMTGRAHIGDGLGEAGGWYSVDGRDDARAGFRSTKGPDALHGKGAVLEDTSAGTGARVGEAGSKEFLYGKEGLIVGTEASLSGKGGMGPFYQEEGMMGTNGSSSAGVGGMCSLPDRDAILGGASPGTGQKAEEIMRSFYGANATRGGSRDVGGRDSHDGEDVLLDVLNTDMDDAQGVGSWHDRDGKLGNTSSRHGFEGVKRSGAADGTSVSDRLNPDSASVGSMRSPYGKDDLYSGTSPGTGAGKNAAGTEIARGIRSPYGKDGMPTIAGINGESINRGEIGKPYGKDDLTVEGSGPAGQQGRPGLLYGPSGLPTGDGAVPGVGGTSVGGMGTLYGPDGLPAGAGVGDATAVKIGGFYGKHGQSGESGAGRGNWIGADVAGKEGMGYPYGKDKFPMGMGAGRGRGLGIVESPYGKGGLPAGTVDSDLGGVGSPYEKDGLPVGMGAGTGVGVGSAAGLGSIGSPYGKDGIPAGTSVGSLGGVSSPYGKDGLQNGVGVGGPGVAGARAFDSPYGKDSLPAGAGGGDLGGIGSPYGKDGLHVGMGAQAGVGGLGVVGSPYGKDGLPAGTGVDGGGAASLGGVGSPYGKDGLLAGAGVGVGSVAGLGGVGSPYGKDGLPAGTGVGSVAGLGGVGSPYGKDGLPAGSGVGSVAGLGGVGFPYGKDGLAAGTGVGSVAGLGGVGSPYGKDGLPAGTGVGSVAGLGGVGSPYGKDGLAAGTGVGSVAGLGGVGSPYGKDGLPAGTGVDGVAGLGGVGSPYGKDGLAAGTGVGSVAGLGGVGSPYGKDGLPAGTGVDGAGSAAGLGGVGSPYGKDGLPAGTGVGAGSVAGLGGVGSPYGKDGLPAGAGVGGVAGLGGVGSPCGKDGLPAEAVGGGAGVAGAGGFGSFYGKDGLPAGAGVDHGGVGGLGGVGSPYGKDGLPAGTGGSAGVAGAGGFGSFYGKDGLPPGAVVGGLGGVQTPYGKDGLAVGMGPGTGVGGAGFGVLGVTDSPYGKDGLPPGAGVDGTRVSGVGGFGPPCGKDGLPAGAAAGGGGVLGGVVSPYRKDGLPAGAGIGSSGVGAIDSLYGKDGLPVGNAAGTFPSGATVAGAGDVESSYGKGGLPAGAGVDGAAVADAGGFGSPYRKDSHPAGDVVGSLGGVGSPYRKDGLSAGAGVDGGGAASLGGVGSPYGKDGIPVGAGAGAGVVAGVGLGGVGTPYGKDGLPSGAGVDGGSAAGLGGVGSPYGKDGSPVGVGAGAGVVAGVDLGGVGTPYGKDGLPSGAGVDGGSAASLGGVGSPYGKDGIPVGAGAGAGVVAGVGLGGVGTPYGKDGLPSGAGVDGGSAAGLGGVGSPYGKDGVPVGVGAGAGVVAGVGLGGVGSPYGKDGLPSGAGVDGGGAASLGIVGSPYGKDGLPAGASVGGGGAASLGGVGTPYGKDGLPAGASVGNLGGVGSPYAKDGLPAGDGVGVFGGIGSLYGKDGLPVGAGAGAGGGGGLGGLGGVGASSGKDGLPPGANIASLGGVGSPYGKDGLPAGTGVDDGGVGGLGGVGSPYGKVGLPSWAGVDGGGAASSGGVGSPYGKDGLPVGAGAGVVVGGGLGGVGIADATAAGSPYGRDNLPAEMRAGPGGARGKDTGAFESSFGKDGLPAGAGVGGGSVGSLGGVDTPYRKDGLLVGMAAGTGASGEGILDAGGVGSSCGKGDLPAWAGMGDTEGIGSPCGKDGPPVGAVGGGLGGVGSPYRKDGLPVGMGTGAGVGGPAVAGAGGFDSPCGKDYLPAGASAGSLGGVSPPYGKKSLPAGTGVDGGGAASVGGVGSPYGKDGLPAGTGGGGAAAASLGGVGSPYGKDDLPAGTGVVGGAAASVGGVGSPYGKDGLPAGTGVDGGGVGGVGSPYGKDGLPVGMTDRTGTSDASLAGVGGVRSSHGKGGLTADTRVGIAGALAAGSPHGKDSLSVEMRAGTGGVDVEGAGGFGSSSGKDGLPTGAGVGVAGHAGAVGTDVVGTPYGKDGLPVGMGAGAGVDGAGIGVLGGAGSLYGKDSLPVGMGAGADGTGIGSLGAVDSPYGKDGLPLGKRGGVGDANVGGLGGVSSPYGKDGLSARAAVGGSGARGFGSSSGNVDLSARDVAGAAHFPFRGEEGRGSYNKDVMLSRTQGYLDGGGAAFRHGRSSSEGRSVGGASAIQAVESSYGKDGVSAGSRAAAGGVGRLGSDERELHSVHGRAGAVGLGGEFGLDSHPGKFSMRGEAGTSAHIDFRGSGHRGSTDDRDSLSGQGSARGEDRDLGQLGSYYSKDSAFGGAGSKSHNRYADGRKSGVLHEGSLAYDQLSDPDGGLSSINQRKQIPGLDIKAKEYLKSTDSMERKRFHKDDLKAPRGRVTKPLVDVRVLKGEPAELSCAVSNDEVKGTWFKDGLKLKSMDGVLFVEEGSVHKLIINKVEDIHAGKYKFEAADMKTEASLFVEDPPHVDKVLLKNLMNVPIEAKAGQKIKIKIPFEGQLPIRATWLKDRMELVDDRRIRVDETDTFTMLTISSSERKDSGDYKVRLKNDHGVLEINLKIVVIDKPQQPTGPIEVLESSASGITIQWKPPKEDGGKPVQSYIVERKQIGQEDWVTLGETLKGCTTFTTNKVEQDTSYYFRVRAVNAEGTSDALKSDQVKAVGKGSPGPPDPPEIVSASKETITISWKTPHKTGNSRIVGYMVQKRKKGANIWMPVTKVPIADKVLKITNLKMGLQYEFRVAAVNAAGVGEASAPSEPVFAQDSTKPPGQVRDLRVASSDSTSITLTWRKPEPKEGVDVKGYEVEMRSYDNLNWTKCSALPINETTYTVKGLQTKELYFLRVRALNDSGPGEAAELEASTEAAPPVVPPRFLIDDRVKSFLIIKAGNTIRVPIPFEASPDPVVTWLKDGLPLPRRATINTEYGTTQLLIEAAEFSDSGTYTVVLQNGSGNKEVFSFQVQVTDIPQSPGPIELEETVPNAVTVTWEPSASEKWESNLYYTVLKRESQKGLWHMVGDLIYTNKFTFTKLIPGRDYYFRVVAKNYLGASAPSETIKPWRLRKEKAKFEVKQPEYREVNQNETPRFLVQLKPHVVTTGTECHMSCAVAGHPPPKITWYKDGRDLSKDSTYLCTNTFGVCSLVILSAAKSDEGEYMVQATNELGRAFSKTFLTIKESSL